MGRERRKIIEFLKILFYSLNSFKHFKFRKMRWTEPLERMQDITKPSIVLNKKTRNQNTRGVTPRQKASSETYLEGMFNCLYIPQNRGLCWVLLTWQ